MLAGLPQDFQAAVLVVQHMDPRHKSVMASLLSRKTQLAVTQAKEGDKVHAGGVWLAPPDYHLLLNTDGTLSLSHSSLVHFVPPSADLLFESVAASRRDRSIAVVLSGTGSDGSLGVKAIKDVGGTVIVEDPTTARFSGMPKAAIDTGAYDFILPLREIADALVRLVEGVGEEGRRPASSQAKSTTANLTHCLSTSANPTVSIRTRTSVPHWPGA